MTTPDLLTRLQNATGPDRELDIDIHKTLGWELAPPEAGCTWWNEDGDTFNGDTPLYTASIDAALPGENIERVSLHDLVEGEPLGTIWEAWHRCEDGRLVMGANRHSEALARRIAALRAGIAEKESEDVATS